MPAFLNSICVAGMASATSRPPERTADSSGRLRTRVRMAPHMRDSPPEARRRFVTNGTRPFSVQPRRLSDMISAGSAVSEPSIATATTSMVPTPNEVNTGLPARNSPAMAVMTVKPEMSTARPDVAAAISSACSGERPLPRSSISRRR